MNSYCLELNKHGSYTFVLDGRALYLHRTKLRKLMHDAGHPSLDRFVYLGTDSESETSKPEWFEPDEGLDFVNALSDVVNAQPSAPVGADLILADVAALKRDLENSRREGVAWRLAECQSG